MFTGLHLQSQSEVHTATGPRQILFDDYNTWRIDGTQDDLEEKKAQNTIYSKHFPWISTADQHKNKSNQRHQISVNSSLIQIPLYSCEYFLILSHYYGGFINQWFVFNLF